MNEENGRSTVYSGRFGSRTCPAARRDCHRVTSAAASRWPLLALMCDLAVIGRWRDGEEEMEPRERGGSKVGCFGPSTPAPTHVGMSRCLSRRNENTWHVEQVLFGRSDRAARIEKRRDEVGQ